MPPNEHLGEMNNRMTATERRSDDVRAKRNRRKQQSEPKRKNKKRSSRSNRSMPPTITRNNQDNKETRFGVQPKNNSADMDYLDIPAFLRRQAD